MSEGLRGKLAWSESDPEEARLAGAIADLGEEDGRAADQENWPDSLWETMEDLGAPRWTLPEPYNGRDCPRPLLVQRYARLAGGSLTAVFILSQHDAALRRLLAAAGHETADRWLNAVGRGHAVGTVGLSHLTTSRRLGPQAIRVTEVGPGRYRLDGSMPWVTAAGRADLVVTAASLGDGRQMLIALPTDRPGVEVCPPFPLAALQASCTSEVTLRAVEVDAIDLIAGPAPDILSHAGAVGTGGLETSALAPRPGAARRSRPWSNSRRIGESSPSRWKSSARAGGPSGASSWPRLAARPTRPLRVRSAPRPTHWSSATQAYLIARKGTGFLRTEPAQRWARQALFFLVWSCPAPLAQAAIRDLAGLCPA